MIEDNRVLAIEGARFFGEMTASVTHEMKNVLAIINENAGLLQDLIQMNRKGTPFNPERLSSLADSIHRQVSRGDWVVKDLNRFAHDTDLPLETVDVVETVHFILRLGNRLLTMKGSLPDLEKATRPVATVTNRFFLEKLVWSSLCHILDGGGPEERIRIVVEGDGENPNIHFRDLPERSLEKMKGFPSREDSLIAEFLNIRFTVEEDENQFSFHFQ